MEGVVVAVVEATVVVEATPVVAIPGGDKVTGTPTGKGMPTWPWFQTPMHGLLWKRTILLAGWKKHQVLPKKQTSVVVKTTPTAMVVEMVVETETPTIGS